MAERVGGIITFKVDGMTYAAKGSFKWNLGIPKREAVMRQDGGVAGYKETPQVPFVEGEITDTLATEITKLVRDVKNATVTLELPNGKSIVLSGAYYAAEGTGETEDGKFPVRFEGVSAEEVK